MNFNFGRNLVISKIILQSFSIRSFEGGIMMKNQCDLILIQNQKNEHNEIKVC